MYVSRAGVNYSQSTLSSISNCPAPNSSFTVNRGTVNSGPVKRHRIQVFMLDAAGQFISPAHYDSNWLNGDFTSKTINNANGLNFQPGIRYRVRVLTESACGSHTFDCDPVITGAPWQAPVVDFNINGSGNFPVNLFTCNNAPMIMNDATTYPGCNPNLTAVFIMLEKAADCNTPIANTQQHVIVPYAASYNLRTLFPAYTSDPGYYRITYWVGGSIGPFGPAVHCVTINGLNPSNAEFKLKAPNNGQPIDRDPNDENATNVVLGGLSAGLYLVNTTSEVGSLDYYRVEIWRTESDMNVETIHNSGNIAINAQHSFPQGYDFNPPTIGYFFNLNTVQKDIYRFKVRFTVHNECGETFQESYFRISPACQFCLVADENEFMNASPASTLAGFVPDRTSDASPAKSTLLVYPNPMEDVLRVRFDIQQPGDALLDVYDATGRSVIQYQRSTGDTPTVYEESFDVRHLPPGMYVWHFGQNGRSETGRLIKN